MLDYQQPPVPRGATTREIGVIAEAHRVACQATDKRQVAPIRNAVELIVDLIEDRNRARSFRDQWDAAIDADGWPPRTQDD